MHPSRFESIGKLFANRRQVLATAHEASPTADEVPADPVTDKTMYLFIQSFQGGSLAPGAGDASRYTLSLDASTGQTVYFGDRPSRDVGITNTPEFLEGLGFSEENPPNAALIVETPDHGTDIAVLELFAPTYDPITGGVTYEVESLAEWEENLELGLQELPTDLAALPTEFANAHLLIDDCPDLTVECVYYSDDFRTIYTVGEYEDVPGCYNWISCIPCEPYGHEQPTYCATQAHWTIRCNREHPDCDGKCVATVGLGGCEHGHSS